MTFAEQYKRSSPYLIVSAAVEYAIKTKQDFELVRKYAPPPDKMDCRLISRAKQAVGDKGLVTIADFFFDGTPYENIRAFADAGREYGTY